MNIHDIPLDDTCWKLVYMPVDKIENNISTAPGAHLGTICQVDLLCQVAVNTAYFSWFLSHGIEYQLVRDPSKPSTTELQVNGRWLATRMAEGRFLWDASQVICSGRSQGLASCYRQSAPPCLRKYLEWAVLSRDVLV